MNSSNRQFLSGAIPALVLAAFSVVWALGLFAWPRSGEPVAAFFPPWVSPHSAFVAASSADAQAILGFGRWKTVVIALSDDPAFAARLREAGALVVLRATARSVCMS
jgi:hypothetical protein